MAVKTVTAAKTATVVPARNVKTTTTKTTGPSAAEVKAAHAKAAPVAETKPVKVTGHRAYATKPVPRAMVGFTAWIAREFPELGKLSDRDARLVMIASKSYRAFQSSDLNV